MESPGVEDDVAPSRKSKIFGGHSWNEASETYRFSRFLKVFRIISAVVILGSAIFDVIRTLGWTVRFLQFWGVVISGLVFILLSVASYGKTFISADFIVPLYQTALTIMLVVFGFALFGAMFAGSALFLVLPGIPLICFFVDLIVFGSQAKFRYSYIALPTFIVIIGMLFNLVRAQPGVLFIIVTLLIFAGASIALGALLVFINRMVHKREVKNQNVHPEDVSAA